MSLALQAPNDHWELSVVGKNITNKITSGSCVNFNAQNGAFFGGQITGGIGKGPAGIDEIGCFVDPGKAVWLRLTVRAFASPE